MKDTEIVEVLSDGTVYHFDMEVCHEVTDEVFDLLANKQGQLLGYDYSATVFTVFVKSIHELMASGWSVQELLREVIDHGSKNFDEE